MKLSLPSVASEEAWRAVAERVDAWLVETGAARRDAIVLVPFASLLPPARRAFARRAGFMPRIETTATLAASLGPEDELPGERAFGHAVATALAGRAVAGAEWAADWAARDPRGFRRAAARTARAARAIGTALGAAAPADRPGRIAAMRAALPPPAGPAERERLFAAVAVEWAAREIGASPPTTDRFPGLAASAWIAVQAGGEDALVGSLLARAAAQGAPVLVVSCDGEADDATAFAGVRSDSVRLAVLDDFEAEAEAAAAQVLSHLGRGERPVALVAVDRESVRRVRALLARQAVVVRDETGWKLSTTRAGARIVGTLRAVEPDATADAVVDWAKSLRPDLQGDVSAFEAGLRRAAVRTAGGIDALQLDPAASRVRSLWHGVRAAFDGAPLRDLPGWLDVLGAALAVAGQADDLAGDDAGRQALAALALAPPLDPMARRALATDLGALDRVAFARLVDDVLEEGMFLPANPLPPVRSVPPAPTVARVVQAPPAPVPGERRRLSNGSGGGQLALLFDAVPSSEAEPLDVPEAAVAELADDAIDVVVTPLARTVLRPFAAAVLAGADEQRLGAPPVEETLLPEPVARAAGLPAADARREGERRALAHLLRLPRTTLLRRRTDGIEVPGESAFVTELRAALEAGGASLEAWTDPRVFVAVAPEPAARPAVAVPIALLPTRVSPSGIDHLRSCPYRFHASRVLALQPVEELDGELDKRGYGTWLHAVLHRFHLERTDAAGRTVAADEAALRAAADSEQAAQGIDAASLSPWRASFEDLVPNYLGWLRERDRRGARWLAGEQSHELAVPGAAGLVLAGKLDRVDAAQEGGQETLELLDYKTGALTGIVARVGDPDEDAQLAAYAAMVAATDPRPIRAFYVPLDVPTEPIAMHEHPDVARSGAALVADLADTFVRLRAGVPIVAIGEGRACAWCDAVGLCRKPHWGDAADPEG